MKKEVVILIFLLLLPPFLGELISASSVPADFFHPFVFLVLLGLYGCGTLLIREAKVRWNLQWSVVFLAVAYGIVEEGIMLKSFFNPAWEGMDVLSGYGMVMGVQWVWVLVLVPYHATLSTLFPITMVELIWPEYKDKPLLKKRGLVIVAFLFLVVVFMGTVFMGSMVEGEMVPFYPRPSLLAASFIASAILIWLAYRLKESRIAAGEVFLLPSFVFGLCGLIFMATLVIFPFIMAENRVPALITVLIQLVLVVLTVLFVKYQIFHEKVTKRHIISLISGVILYWIIISPVLELSEPGSGMIVVGLITFILLLVWRRRVLRKAES